MPRILVVDDEPDIRELLEITLNRMGMATTAADNLTTARSALAGADFQLCLTDMRLPDGDGLTLVEHIQEYYPQTPVAVITAHGSIETAITALKAGAFDFVSKPVDLSQLRSLVNSAIRLERNPPVSGEDGEPQLLGDTAAIVDLRRQIDKLARSQAPVYIGGESGTGKELVARLIHANGPRATAPFVPVNCGAIPTELMESEFFGHKKGAFTGAVEDKQGLFQAAAGGTLFLDEVADLPLSMQVKLLRAIQEKAVRPVGSPQEMAIDVRILSATHKDLAHEVEQERFRGDLYYRINVIQLRLPSLRERAEDIPTLAGHILAGLAKQWATECPILSDDAIAALAAYPFPGNVRELENILERAGTLCETNTIRAEDLSLPTDHRAPAADTGTAATVVLPTSTALPDEFESLEEYLEAIERSAINHALEATRWNKTEAAKRLGISFRALRYRLKKLDLE